MSKDQDRFDQPIPPTTVCADCGRSGATLRRCRLTGMGDHARHIILCGECLQRMIVKSPSAERAREPASPAMSEKERRYETRRQKAFARLGTDHPMCACCAETNWRCMELHHLEGKEFGKTLIVVCRNCHRKLSDAQKDHTPTQLGPPPTTIESIGQFLQGLADLLLMLAEKLWEFGEYLLEQAHLQPPKKQPSQS
jgi:hypothetical protein